MFLPYDPETDLGRVHADGKNRRAARLQRRAADKPARYRNGNADAARYLARAIMPTDGAAFTALCVARRNSA